MTHLPFALGATLVFVCLSAGCDSSPDSSSAPPDGTTDATTTADGSAQPSGDASGPEPDAAGQGDIEAPPADVTSSPDDAGPTDTSWSPPDAVAPSCDTDGTPIERAVRVPLGETLDFSGDDYLAFWGADHPCAVELLARPDGAEGELVADGSRLTPDAPGQWQLRRGEDLVTGAIRGSSAAFVFRWLRGGPEVRLEPGVRAVLRLSHDDRSGAFGTSITPPPQGEPRCARL